MKALQIVIEYFALVGLGLSLLVLFAHSGRRSLATALINLHRKLGAFGLAVFLCFSVITTIEAQKGCVARAPARETFQLVQSLADSEAGCARSVYRDLAPGASVGPLTCPSDIYSATNLSFYGIAPMPSSVWLGIGFPYGSYFIDHVLEIWGGTSCKIDEFEKLITIPVLGVRSNLAIELPRSQGVSNEYTRAEFYQVRARQDSDNDGVSDTLEEEVYHTNPHLADTDGDGDDDGWEIWFGFDPLSSAPSIFPSFTPVSAITADVPREESTCVEVTTNETETGEAEMLMARSAPSLNLPQIARQVGDSFPPFDREFDVVLKPVADAICQLYIAADDDLEVTGPGFGLEVTWDNDRGAEKSADLSLHAGEECPLHFKYHNNGGSHFLTTRLVVPDAVASIEVTPKVVNFSPTAEMDFSTLAPAVKIDGIFNPFGNYSISAELSEGLVSSGKVSLNAIENLPMSVPLRVWPNPADELWSRTGTNTATVCYHLYDGREEISSASCTFVAINPKPKDDCDCCQEGTLCKDGSVYFSQKFGATPLYPSLPAGRVVVIADTPNTALWTPGALRYDHPMMRRIYYLRNLDAVIFDGLGVPTEYKRGLPSGASAGEGGQLFCSPDGEIVEELPDGLRVIYNATGHVVALQPRFAGCIPVESLGINISYANDGSISVINSLADGLMTASPSDNTPHAWDLLWTAPNGNRVKAFHFGGDGTTTFTLSEERNETFTFNYRWTYSASLHDWVFEKGVGTPDAIREEKSLHYDSVTKTWSMIHSTVDESGTTLSSSSSLLNRDNHTIRETERRDAVSGALLYSSVVDSAGRITSETDENGCTTSYAYDSFGRLIRETVSAPGTPVRVVETSYSPELGPVEFRPEAERVFLDGILFSETRHRYTDNGAYHERHISGQVRRSYEEYDALGALVLAVDESARAKRTAYEYFDDVLVETVDEGIEEDGVFNLVPGKSTREIRTRDASGNVLRSERLALIEDTWQMLSWETNAYNAVHKRIFTEYSDGTTEGADYICTGPVWQRDRNGILITNTYNSAKALSTSTRCSPLGDVTTRYVYDGEGRVIREETFAANCETQTVARVYDSRGRVTRETDAAGRVTRTVHDDLTRLTTVTYADGGTRILTLNVDGSLASITGTAVTPEYYYYGVTNLLVNGVETLCRYTRTTYGRLDSPRFSIRYENGFGEIVREERSGFGGATLVTENVYNTRGQLVARHETGRPDMEYDYDAWGDCVAETQRVDGEWRRTEAAQGNVLLDGEVWRGSVRTLSTSDATIVPLVTQSYARLSELSLDCESENYSVDVRGNTNRTWSALDPSVSKRMTWSLKAGVGNASLAESVDDATVRTVDAGAVTNSVAYDAFRRQLATTDGRGNVTTYAYDSHGRLSTVTDPIGAVTAYAYDPMGRISAVTNALGNVTMTRYDVCGNKVYEGGATYPVSYTYDIYGNRTTMTTYRNENSQQGDTTTWVYDEATGLLTQKLYADGLGPSYAYTPDGKLATRTWARGVVTSYAYDGWGNLIATTYSDNTPSVLFTYDTLGRKKTACDVSGLTAYAYDDFGAESQLVVDGLYSKTLDRHYDVYGRNTGYSLDGARQIMVGYDEHSGRVASAEIGGIAHAWEYLPGTELKSRLNYGTAGSAEWTYERQRDLLTQVRNSAHGSIISQYDYTNDAAGRRISKNYEVYGYNERSELVSASGNGNYSYVYDDIGNRISSTEPEDSFSYTANNLNQYTQIFTVNLNLQPQPFVPQYDLDGNQTLVKTKTGIWSVTYNGENRPVNWTCGVTNIVMKYDRMGRRVEYLETVTDASNSSVVTNKHQRFVYDNYLCVQRLDATSDNAVTDTFVWDSTEPIATRPLYWQTITTNGSHHLFYTHDGNKNVSDGVHYTPSNGVAAHYEYTPFGEVRSQTGACAAANPFRFSSEYADDTLGLDYYNYRHYEPIMGRWLSRDPQHEYACLNLFAFCDNDVVYNNDKLGLKIDIKEDKEVVTTDGLLRNRARFIHVPMLIRLRCGLGRLKVTGDVHREIRILPSDHPAWKIHFRRYDMKWGKKRTDSEERKIALLHENDHWKSFDHVVSFARMLNEFDGVYFGSCCEQIADEYEVQFNRLYIQAKAHSDRYDTNDYNSGGEWPNGKKKNR